MNKGELTRLLNLRAKKKVVPLDGREQKILAEDAIKQREGGVVVPEAQIRKLTG
jgi:hypothetical protein